MAGKRCKALAPWPCSPAALFLGRVDSCSSLAGDVFCAALLIFPASSSSVCNTGSPGRAPGQGLSTCQQPWEKELAASPLPQSPAWPTVT